jgi:hypothetical protein
MYSNKKTEKKNFVEWFMKRDAVLLGAFCIHAPIFLAFHHILGTV